MLGWGISLLVHGLAVAWLWHSLLPRRVETDAAPVRRIELRLVPLTPQARPAAPIPNTALPRPAPARPRTAPRQPPRQQASRERAVAPAQTAATDALPADAAKRPGSDTRTDTGTEAPAVDLAAARATARLIARENGKGFVALPGRKPVDAPNAERPIADRLERARRVDCQTARAGSTNLLANVIGLAVDLAKNAVDDSGCKW